MQFGQVWDDADPDNAPIRLEDAIAEILRHDADVIQLQEVEHANAGGGQVQPPPNYERLREALAGYHGHFSYPPDDPRELPFGIGLATFSRTPLLDTFAEVVPSPPLEFNFFGQIKTPTDRLLIGAKTEIGGREVQFLNTHLLAFFMLKASNRDYPQQRAKIAEHLRNAGTRATVLSGDFNAPDHEELAEEYAACGFATTQTEEITWRRRPYVLDHIFYNSPLRCVDRRVFPTMSSDHHVLIADFVFA